MRIIKYIIVLFTVYFLSGCVENLPENEIVHGKYDCIGTKSTVLRCENEYERMEKRRELPVNTPSKVY